MTCQVFNSGFIHLELTLEFEIQKNTIQNLKNRSENYIHVDNKKSCSKLIRMDEIKFVFEMVMIREVRCSNDVLAVNPFISINEHQTNEHPNGKCLTPN